MFFFLKIKENALNKQKQICQSKKWQKKTDQKVVAKINQMKMLSENWCNCGCEIQFKNLQIFGILFIVLHVGNFKRIVVFFLIEAATCITHVLFFGNCNGMSCFLRAQLIFFRNCTDFLLSSSLSYNFFKQRNLWCKVFQVSKVPLSSLNVIKINQIKKCRLDIFTLKLYNQHLRGVFSQCFCDTIVKMCNINKLKFETKGFWWKYN